MSLATESSEDSSICSQGHLGLDRAAGAGQLERVSRRAFDVERVLGVQVGDLDIERVDGRDSTDRDLSLAEGLLQL